MNRTILLVSIMIGCVGAWAGHVQACTTPPDVYISDWICYVGVGQGFSFTADDSSGTPIVDWWWDYDYPTVQCTSGATSCQAYFVANSPGSYYCWANARNEYDLTDCDYGVAFVVSAGITSCPSAIPYQSEAEIQFSLLPDSGPAYRHYAELTVVNSSYQTVHSEYLDGGVIGSVTCYWNGKDDAGNWAPPGQYFVTLDFHTGDSGECVVSDYRAIEVTAPPAVTITTPLSAAYVAKSNYIQLDCTPSSTNGTYSYAWSQTGGTGAGTFNNPNIKNPTFTGTTAGPCTIRVQYTLNGVTVSDTRTALVTVIDLTVGTLTGCVGVNTDLQLSTTPQGATDGSFTWTPVVPSPGNVTFTNGTTATPKFKADHYGDYMVHVSYAKGGAVVGKDIGPLTVIDVSVSTPNTYPAVVGLGSTLQLGATPRGATGGSYTWTKVSGPGTVTFVDGTTATPRFSADQPGDYVVGVVYSIGSASSPRRDSGTITVPVPTVAIDAPAYVAVGNSLQLDCTPSVGGGGYLWSQVSGPATGTFSRTDIKNPTFTADTAGIYVIKVEYTVGAVTVSDTKNPVNVVGVSINTAFPTYMPVNASGRVVGCFSPIEGGTYVWSKESGPGTITFWTSPPQSPPFSVSAPGEYRVKVEYTVGGITVSAISGSIYALTFEIAGALPGLMQPGQVVHLDCNPSMTGGTYTWQQIDGTGSGTFSDVHAKNPTFTATQAGPCSIRVDYTIGDRTFTASAGTTAIVDLAVSPAFPAYAIGLNDSALLAVTQTGGLAGTFSWSQRSGPGTLSFAPSADGAIVTVSASEYGAYMLRVTYDFVGGVLTKDVGPLTFADLSITRDLEFTGVNTPLSLNATVQGLSDGTYAWTKLDGPGNVTFAEGTTATPRFSADQPGNYTVQLTYTADSQTLVRTVSIPVLDMALGEHPRYWAYKSLEGADINYTITPSDPPYALRGGAYLILEDVNEVAVRTQYLGWALGTQVARWDGKMDNGSWAPEGVYTATIKFGALIGDPSVSSPPFTLTVVGIRIVTPSSYPAFPDANNVVQLDSKPSLLGGTYTWSQIGGTGAGTFDNVHVKNPKFTFTQTGLCLFKVEYNQYATDAVPVAATTGPISTADIGVRAELTLDGRCFVGSDGYTHQNISVLAHARAAIGGAWTLTAISGYEPDEVIVRSGYGSPAVFPTEVPFTREDESAPYTWTYPPGTPSETALEVVFKDRTKATPDLVLELSYNITGINGTVRVAASSITVHRPITLLNIPNPETKPIAVAFSDIPQAYAPFGLSFSQMGPSRLISQREFRLDYDAGSTRWKTDNGLIEVCCTPKGNVRVVVHATVVDGQPLFDSTNWQPATELPQSFINYYGGTCEVGLWNTSEWNSLSTYQPGDVVAGSSCDGFTEVYTCMTDTPAAPGTNNDWYLGHPCCDLYFDHVSTVGQCQWGLFTPAGYVRASVLSCGGQNGYWGVDYGNDYLTPPQGSLTLTLVEGADRAVIVTDPIGYVLYSEGKVPDCRGTILFGAGGAASRTWSLQELFAGLTLLSNQGNDDFPSYNFSDWELLAGGFDEWPGPSWLGWKALAPGPITIRADLECGGLHSAILKINPAPTPPAITDVVMPNDFIAMPSFSNLQHFEGCQQLAKTNLRVKYVVDPFYGAAEIEFKHDAQSQSLPIDLSKRGPDGSGYADIELDLDDAWAVDGTVHIDVTLTATHSATEKATCTRQVDGKCLISNLQFSPQGSFSPYTSEQAPISGTNPDDKWFGLLTTYDLGGITLDRIDAMVSGGDTAMGGTKLLLAPPGALDGTNCKIKWEGYDTQVIEPAESPVSVFPGKQYVDHVAEEGVYRYDIEARDSLSATQPDKVLQQTYKIQGIQIGVVAALFRPDKETHKKSDALTIFPGDTELLSVSSGAVIPTVGAPVKYSVLDSSIAEVTELITDEGESVDPTEPATVRIERLRVRGLKPGVTKVRATLSGGNTEGEIQVYVGGTIQMTYSDVPTYGTGDATGDTDTGDRDTIPADVISEIPGVHLTSDVTITLTDARGDAKPCKPVAVASDGKFDITVPGSASQFSYTDRDGVTHVTVSCNSQCDSCTTSVDKGVLLATVGEDSIPYQQGAQASNYSDVEVEAHENDLQSLTYTRTFSAANNTRSAMAITMPVINHYQYVVFKQALEGGVYASGHEMEGTITITTYDPATGQLLDPANQSIPATQYPFGDSAMVQGLKEHVAGAKSTDFSGNNVTFTSTTSSVVKTSAIAAELALSMAPGGDFIDVCKEFIWKRFFVKDESPNYIVGIVSFVGLCADAGYLTGIGGAPANLVAGTLKVLCKFVPEPLLKAVVKSFDSVLGGLKKIYELIHRAPGGGTIDKLSHLISQWRRLLDSPLGLSASHAADAVDVMAKRAARHYRDEAVEGIAAAAKGGKKATVENIVTEFGDDIAEASAEIFRILDIPSGRISAKGMRGVSVSIEAVGPANKHLLEEFVQGEAIVNDLDKANKTFENLETLRGVDGLNEQVAFLRNNRNNLTGIDGAIHESTVARKIRTGEVATIDGQPVGNLTRVSGDGMEDMEKIDTVTDSFAIQIKTQQTGNAGIGVLGDSIIEAQDYCRELGREADVLHKTPALITNAPLTEDLMDLLESNGIKWLVVSP